MSDNSNGQKKLGARKRFAAIARRADEAGFSIGITAVPEVGQDVVVVALHRVNVGGEDFSLDVHLDRLELFLDSAEAARASDSIEKINALNESISESQRTRDALVWSLSMAPEDSVTAFVDRARAASLATYVASQAGVRVQMASDEDGDARPGRELSDAVEDAVDEILQARRDDLASQAETLQEVPRR